MAHRNNDSKGGQRPDAAPYNGSVPHTTPQQHGHPGQGVPQDPAQQAPYPHPQQHPPQWQQGQGQQPPAGYGQAPVQAPPQGGQAHAAAAPGAPQQPADPAAAAPNKKRKDEKPGRRKLRHNRIVRLLQMLMSLTFLGAVGLAGFYMYSRHQIDRPGPLNARTIFEVERGYGLSTIASKLHQKGIIRDKRLFAMNAVSTQKAKKLKAGKYAIPPQASMQKVLDILVAGKAIFYQVTVPEGLTSQQAVAILSAHPQLKGEITQIPTEGHVMPNTYRFSDGADRNDILQKMVAAQDKLLAQLWESRQPGLPLKTPEEALILASIVEKETGQSSERKRVAGVFVNRLRKGMKLQSDPTIIYGLVGGKGKLGHPLRRSEMNKKTAYNTYQINGLPPTPIANPGRLAIEAVLNPEQTADLYFVADGTGGHAFAPSLKKHQENVRKWRKIEKARRREQKRKEAEAARLAKLAAKQQKQQAKNKAKLPGVSISAEGAERLEIPKNGRKGWDNTISLPVRNPRR